MFCRILLLLYTMYYTPYTMYHVLCAQIPDTIYSTLCQTNMEPEKGPLLRFDVSLARCIPYKDPYCSSALGGPELCMIFSSNAWARWPRLQGPPHGAQDLRDASWRQRLEQTGCGSCHTLGVSFWVLMLGISFFCVHIRAPDFCMFFPCTGTRKRSVSYNIEQLNIVMHPHCRGCCSC